MFEFRDFLFQLSYDEILILASDFWFSSSRIINETCQSHILTYSFVPVLLVYYLFLWAGTKFKAYTPLPTPSLLD